LADCKAVSLTDGRELKIEAEWSCNVMISSIAIENIAAEIASRDSERCRLELENRLLREELTMGDL